MLSGELLDPVDSHPLCLVQCWKHWGSFSSIYLLLKYVGGPEKDQVCVAGQEISKSSLCVFFL